MADQTSAGDRRDALERRLDLRIALTRLSVCDALASADLRADPVSAAILANAGRFDSAGQLKSAVMRQTGQSKPTVERRIADMVAAGVIARRGSGPASAISLPASSSLIPA